MSYRTFKRVLGETSLERKCRFLFGASLLVLILTTFLLVESETSQIIHDKPRSSGRHLAGSVLRALHSEWLSPAEQRAQIQEMNEDMEGLDYQWSILSLDGLDRPYSKLPSDRRETEILNELQRLYRQRFQPPIDPAQSASGEEQSFDFTSEEIVPKETQIYETFKHDAPVCYLRKMDVLGEHRYYQPVYWQESCLSCHRMIDSEALGDLATDLSAPTSQVLASLPFRVVRIDLKSQPMNRNINRIRAFLIAMAIVTVFLSMIALYIVVRYVIVKPLQHLQEVSEQVEQGNYQARAQIETRDEFEDLAGSFNRMLRHLVDTQGELQEANKQLDLKVDELAQANMQLFELNRLKSEFLANVSHELRTPLNSIIGFSDVLQNIDTLAPKQKRYASNIGNSGRVLLEMINDILDLAKMESGKMLVRPSEFSISAVALAQIDVVQGLAVEKNLGINFECPEDLPDVFQDQAKVQQILTNLLSNAIKFTPDGGRITVTIKPIYDEGDETQPQAFTLTVADTGIGIAEEDHDVIFEKFRQATPVRGQDNLTREFSGTGLGLSIIRELCNLLGGEVTFVSQLGHGSAFTVRLPWTLRMPPRALGDDFESLPDVAVPRVG